ncbi:hypothetical protein KAI87_09730, partial [Myxococcota bacterium]|nr:hypothetical protein [Myxococcota bacterium]
IAASRQMDKTSRVGELSKALQKVVQRVALNGELRIVDASGIGVSNPYSHADIADALEAAKVALKVQVVAEGPYGEEFRNLLVESLISKGYQASSESDGEFDVLVKAKVQMEDGGKSKMRGRTVHFARCMINIEIQNASTKRIIGSVSDSRKEGQSSLSEAKRRAVQRLAKKLSKKLGSKIDKAMSGG